MKVVQVNGKKIKVVYPEEVDDFLTPEDKEMDARCREAVAASLRKKNFLELLREEKSFVFYKIL